MTSDKSDSVANFPGADFLSNESDAEAGHPAVLCWHFTMTPEAKARFEEWPKDVPVFYCDTDRELPEGAEAVVEGELELLRSSNG